MNNEQEIGQSGPIKKQQLFVHPIALINKLNSTHNQSQQKLLQTSLIDQPNNFSQLIIDSAQSNFTPQSKTKIILKSQSNNNKFKNYKTSICPYGMQCRKRLTCHYAHNQNQLRRPYKNRKNPCLRYQKGLCGLGAACPDYHGNIDLKKKNYKYKVLPCKEWEEKGKCSKGELCIYIHGQQQGNQIQQENNEINNETHNQDGGQIIENNNQQKIEQNSPPIQCKNQITVFHNKQKIGNIFKTQQKKTIIAKQVIEQPIKQATEINNDKNPEQDDNFNIEFNF